MKMTAHTAQLGELVTIVGGGTPSRDRPEYYNGGIPWMTVKDFNDEFFIRNSQEHISTRGVENSASRIIPAGNVILGTRMSVGKAAINLVDLAINQDLKALFCCSKLNPLYLTFFLAAASPRLEAQASGATVKGITIDDVETLEIPLPNLSEQKRIGKQLEQAYRLRRTRRYALELSDTFLPAAFLELFGDPSFPKLTLDELVLTERGSFVNGPFGSDLLTSELVSEGVPVIYIRDISEGRYVRTSTVCVTPAKAEELAIFEVHPGDVLVAKVGDPPGIAAIYPHGEPVGVITQDVIRMRLDPGLVLPRYLLGLLNSDVGMKLLKPIIVEGTRMRFGLTSFKEVAIPVPPLQLQRHFAALAEREALRQAEHLFQTLLHSSFSEGMSC